MGGVLRFSRPLQDSQDKLCMARFAGVVGSLCAALLLCVAISTPVQAGDQDFELINQTGVDIYALYASPHSASDWEEDILGLDVLLAGDSVTIQFDPAEAAALWDLRVEDENGDAIEWERLNLLRISIVTLYFEDGRAWAEVE